MRKFVLGAGSGDGGLVLGEDGREGDARRVPILPGGGFRRGYAQAAADDLPAAERPRGGAWGRPRNRRVVFQRREPLVVVAEALARLARRVLTALRFLGKAVLTLGVIAAIIWGGRLATRHVIASPRFELREIAVAGGGERVGRDEVLELAEVAEGDRLLEIDPDQVAARVARHPWVASVRVRRQLPRGLSIELRERRAAAAAALGGLYLIDERGHPFKRATMEEADGLAVVTGVARAQYVAASDVAEGAFREALALLEQYRAEPGRPPVSEVNLDPRFGMTLFLRDGGAEIRLGRGEVSKKLARFDQIFEAVKADGPVAALRVVHLDRPDGAGGARIPVRLAEDRKKD
jgi:cell division protein FtsQ